eukprot:766252-Hanusia_phi.AAC.3
MKRDEQDLRQQVISALAQHRMPLYTMRILLVVQIENIDARLKEIHSQRSDDSNSYCSQIFFDEMTARPVQPESFCKPICRSIAIWWENRRQGNVYTRCDGLLSSKISVDLNLTRLTGNVEKSASQLASADRNLDPSNEDDYSEEDDDDISSEGLEVSRRGY